MRIRVAGASDIVAMHSLRSRVIENALSDQKLVTEKSYLPYLALGAAWIAETEDGLVGFAILDVAAASVWALFVAPEAERKGIGRALHDRLIEGAAGRGLERLSLSTAPGTRAERFYADAGWIKTGRTGTGELSFEKILVRQSNGFAKENRGD